MNRIADDYLVTPEFRKLLIERFPAIEHSLAYRLLLGYILFGTWVDSVTGELIIQAGLLADMEGKGRAYDGSNYKALDLIDSFSKDVFTVNWRAQNINVWPRQARRIVSTLLLPDIEQLALQENQVGTPGLIWLGSGNAPSPNGPTKLRQELLEQANENRDKAKSPEAKVILDYLNDLAPDRFTRLVNANLSAALAIAKALPTRKARERELKLLKGISYQPKPFYRPVMNSARLYPLNASLLVLQKDVRKGLTKGWYSADLEAAQLAIISKLWNCPKTMDFLDSKGSIWTDLFNHFKIEASDEIKAVFKQGLYRIAFGNSEKSLEEFLTKELPNQNAFSTFMAHPIIDEVMTAREAVKAKIKVDKGLVDAFGNELKLETGKDWNKSEFSLAWYAADNKLSLMAQQAQSYELKLLWPVFEKAIERSDKHGYVITSLLFDGFTYARRCPKSS